MFGLTARMCSTSIFSFWRTDGRKLVRKTSLTAAILYSTSRPSSVEMSRPIDRFPRLGCSMM